MYTRALQGYKHALGPELLPLYFLALNRLFVFHCYSELIARNISVGIAEGG
jgi:hypothetical protein